MARRRSNGVRRYVRFHLSRHWAREIALVRGVFAMVVARRGCSSAMLGARDPYVVDIPAAARRISTYVASAGRVNFWALRHVRAAVARARGEFLRVLAGLPLARSVSCQLKWR